MKSIAMLLAGCAGQPPVHGNAKGGVMQWFGMNARQTHAAADKHCGKYSKQARITEMRSEVGDHVLFECV